MIHVNICGHNSHHPTPCNIEHEHGFSDYLLLLVKTKAWFYIDKKRTVTEPNMAILFDKNTYIRYGCDIAGYNDDWIHFYMSEEEKELLSKLSLPMNTPLYGLDIHSLSRYVSLLTDSFHAKQHYSEEVSDSLMHALLYKLGGELTKAENASSSHKYYTAFSKLRTSLYNTPSEEWSADYACRLLDLSISYFQHLYKQFFDCSFQQDIIRARMEHAKFYLRSSNMPIKKLAEFCGYHNELHFMRQFKKTEGMTPSEFRRNYLL
ncbi:helix-turn-helix transcriptional regulator [Konateibacter massiliensis]|uniref:helix-turn-helix transcriptional regulator n=1 Tax=Konateibacter massiliensis TaxID=2002841 RepID=UPI000C15CC0F|nr:AraC family transcriptional regulator [Konateibacter massiliensis]